MPGMNNPRKEACRVGGFESMVFGSIDVGSIVRQNSKVMGEFGRESHLKADRGQGATGRDRGMIASKYQPWGPTSATLHGSSTSPYSIPVFDPQVPHWVRAHTF